MGKVFDRMNLTIVQGCCPYGAYNTTVHLEEHHMANALEMHDDGTSESVCITRNSLTSERVLCVIDGEGKNVFLWLGKEAPVRKRFVGAHTASKLRDEQGTGFRVRSLDEGSEPPQFFNSLEHKDC